MTCPLEGETIEDNHISTVWPKSDDSPDKLQHLLFPVSRGRQTDHLSKGSGKITAVVIAALMGNRRHIELTVAQ